MQSLSVKKSLLNSTIQIPASKSYANRALIVSAIKKSPKLFNLPESSDVKNLIKALKQIGLKTKEENGFEFINSFPECETNDQLIDIGDGGTTARFISAMLLLGKKKYQLKLGGRLKERPWQEFISLCKILGAKAELVDDLLTIQGPVVFPQKITIDCSRTTQFATAFALLKPVTKCEIIPENMSSSQSYWRMTDKVIGELEKSGPYNVPRDWSSASYPLAFAALNQEIEFPGLHFDQYQADAKFFNILKELDCISETTDGVMVKKSRKKLNYEIDVSDCLDLVPTLGYFLSHIPGIHSLIGIDNLVHKESDRLNEVIELVKLFDRKAYLNDNGLIIEGSLSTIQKELDLKMPDDHRMVMAGTLFLLQHQGGSIAPQKAVEKSFPDFFSIISKI